MEQDMQQKPKGFMPWIVAAVIVAVGGIAAFAGGLFNQTPSQKPQDTSGQPIDAMSDGQPNQTPATSGQKYANGTYTKDVTYRSPGGDEQFTVSLVIADDTVTQATFTPRPVSPVGVTLQGKFSTDFTQYVVGKNLDSISFSVISGASLTTNAFRQALDQIKQQALQA